MNIDQLRQQFPDENTCRKFFGNGKLGSGPMPLV
jgi:hypothetical protein